MHEFGTLERVLFLSIDPQRVSAQLAGHRLSRAEAGPLRDDISTDEITPIPFLTVFDERLGRYPYTGVKCGNVLPIGTDAIRECGFNVVVAGKRYGKGSSREHSPMAELSAGVRLVFAESFERIYRQNADNLGLLTSTDFGLLDRLLGGEAISLDEVIAPRDALTQAIIRAGGLLAHGARHFMDLPPVLSGTNGPQTYFEKILARHGLVLDGQLDLPDPGQPFLVRPDWRFIHEYYTGMCAHMLDKRFGTGHVLKDVHSIVAFEDHLSYAHRSEIHQRTGVMPNLRQLVAAHREFVTRHGLVAHGTLPAGEGSEGISHALMTERHALPGQVVVGTDSHTPHIGALGCLAFGVGSTDMATAMLTNSVRLTLPQAIRIELQGHVPSGISAKDIVLHLLAHEAIRKGEGVGRVFEFAGSALSQLSTDERATLTNMTAELGGFAGLVVPDAETVRFLKARRGMDFQIEPWMRSDPGARYAAVIEIDCAQLEPMVASPGDPGNGVPLSSLVDRTRLNIAYGGSCTAGKREDFDQYFAVLSWAHEQGIKVHPDVTLYLQFGTVDVRSYCEHRGYIPVFESVGAQLLAPSCGACANCGPGASLSAEDVTVSAINRNFPGRSGPGAVWLASPATVAASAIAGHLASFEELQAAHA